MDNNNNIIFMLLDQTQQQIKNSDAILSHGQGIIHTGLSVQSQQQVTAAIKQSQTLFNNIQKKTQYLQNKHVFNPSLMNKISAFSFVDEKYLIDQWQPPDVEKMSVLPVMANIVMAHVQNFLSVQLQIDPFTKKLIKMPDETETVLNFVTNLCDHDVVSQFAMLDTQYGANRLNFHNKRDLWSPVLKHILMQLQRVNYMVSQQIFIKALFNPDLKVPATQQELTSRNDAQLQNMLTNSFNMENLTYINFMQSTIVKQVKKKRDIYKKKPPRFFSVIANPTDYEKMIQLSLQQQRNELAQIGVINDLTWKQLIENKPLDQNQEQGQEKEDNSS